METIRLEKEERQLRQAAEILRRGGIVAFPTETVFGLGADATNPSAVQRLFQAKGRPADNPLIVHLAEPDDWPLAVSSLPTTARQLLSAFAPGPLTVVVPKQECIAPAVTAGLPTVAVRVPSNPVARELVRLVGRPIAAPSANRSGRPSATTWQSVLEDLDGRIDAVVCDNPSEIGVESTVVDCCQNPPVVLRRGAVTEAQIAAVVGQVSSPGNLQGDGAMVNSPGVRHPHYQPTARVRLVDSPPSADELRSLPGRIAYCGLQGLSRAAASRVSVARTFTSLEEYARDFYEFLRLADRDGAAWIVVERAKPEGIGAALLDRQTRAADR
ncbi:MAG: threonylcarbamoyl-AMP synthase [Planctomycetota bacterium]|nr:MAG: threonylcarbamoyl-AMP synthase [Planctomycetota bacterium]